MRKLSTGLALLSLLGCGEDTNAEAEVRDSGDPSTLPDAGAGDAGPGTCEFVDTDAGLVPNAAYSPGCDLTGVWAARQTAQSLALSLPQFASTWFYYELRQTGSALEVVEHLDCGAEVRGTVTVQLTPQTIAALMAHNRQVGRKGSVSPTMDGSCAVALERFWSVRGVDEARYLPTPRNKEVSLETLQRELPLPPSDMPQLAADWDADGQPGTAWNISGIVTGVRHSAQRDWTRYFTAPGYTIRAAEDFRDDLVIRTAYAVEEVVYAPKELRQAAQPACAAPHTLTLRFLGRTRDDPRAKAVVGADDAATCAKIRAALPAAAALR